MPYLMGGFPGLETSAAVIEAYADTGADLNAYAKVEGQGGCCSPAMATASTGPEPLASIDCCAPGAAEAPSGSLSIVADDCCGTSVAPPQDDALHARLAELLKRHDVNEFAASVRVYAVKPAQR